MGYFWDNLAAQGSFDILALLVLAAAKATLLLAFAALLCVAVRRLSAATRHLIWASALCASLLLPGLSFVKMWEVPILPARLAVLNDPGMGAAAGNADAFGTKEGDATVSPPRSPGAGEGSEVVEAHMTAAPAGEFSPQVAEAPATPSANTTSPIWPRLLNVALAVWGLGVLLLLLKLLAGFAATGMLSRRATKFTDPALTELFSSLLNEINLKGRVSLLRSERTSMPIVYGIIHPAVLLPAEAEAWSDERRRMVLLHELTHVTRRDCLTQMLAQLACAVYWFNPFVWVAARRLRVEREQACDDYVLSIGTKPSDYANHLLEIARSMQERRVFEWAQTTSVAMARRSQLEGRLLAILNKESARGVMPRATVMGIVALICVLLLSLAVIRPTVIHAHHPRELDSASNDHREGADSDLVITTPAIETERGTGAAGGDAESRAVDDERPDAPATGGNPQSPILSDRHVEGVAEQRPAEIVEPAVRQGTVEVEAERSAAVVQPPGAGALAGREANLFINAGFQQQSPSAQTPAGRGDYIDEMSAAGYTNLSVDDLIRLKTARVTAAYVSSLRALGYTNLTPKELSAMSIHGVAPGYIESLRAAGFNALSAKQLTTFRIHGVTPEYVRTLREAGYGNLEARQLIEFKIHGVTPAFIGGIRSAGFGNLSPKEIVSLRIYAITPEFIRTARARLGELTIRQVISLKNMGILDGEKGTEKVKEKVKEKEKEKDKR